MNINQAMLCFTCGEISPTATHCPICRSQDTAELSGHAETIEENEREQRRDDLLDEIRGMRERIVSADIDAEPLGVGA